MSITINIAGVNAAEVAQQVKELASMFGAAAEVAATLVEEKPKTARKPVTKKEAAPVVEETDVTDEDIEELDGEDEVEIPDDVALRAAAQALGKKPGGKAKVKALLEKYDVPNVTGVPDDQRVAFLADLQKG